jgi:dolichol-phosphate mannosyltransferase
MAVTAGIDHARGDYVALIDADLQDPPEALAPMLATALGGYDVVYGQRRSRRGETLFKRATAAAFYRLLSSMCEVDIPRDTGDFRIMSRRVADVLRQMRERHRFIRGMVPWAGFRATAYTYDRDERFAGVTKYPLRRMLRFASNAILSFSTKPLAVAMRVGIAVVFAGLAGAAYMTYLKLFTHTPVAGVTAILVAIAILSGTQIMLTALVGSYVARVFEEAKNRPLYVVAERANLGDE